MLYKTKNPHGGDVYSEPIRLDFSANTNPYGTPQGVLDAVCSALKRVHQYPDPYCRELTRAISAFEQVPEEYILCGNGAAELIYSYCEATRPAKAMELAPTFAEYSMGLERVGCEVCRYPLHQENDFALNGEFLDALNRERPDAVFLCNPNNPTGRTIAPELLDKIIQWCSEQDTRLFLDECFLDLTEEAESMKWHLRDHPELFILKAFTKSYGMAGIRLGYCLCADSALLESMSRTVQPWNVSALAQAAGVAALKEQDFLQSARMTIFQEKRRMKGGLEQMGFYVCPGEANYLLFCAEPELHLRLKAEGIAIRDCSNYYGLAEGWYRVAVRLHEENEALLAAIRCVCGKE